MTDTGKYESIGGFFKIWVLPKFWLIERFTVFIFNDGFICIQMLTILCMYMFVPAFRDKTRILGFGGGTKRLFGVKN
jgi:hypothetical protein